VRFAGNNPPSRQHWEEAAARRSTWTGQDGAVTRPAIVLVHSPLCGPSTWSRLAPVLADRGWTVVRPDLDDDGRPPCWRQHADSVAAQVPRDRAPLLVAHSGAGALLPSIDVAAAGYVFLDAGLPGRDGMSRLDVMATESAEFAGSLRADLESGGRFPAWTPHDLRDLVPDPSAFIADLRPRGLDFFAEPIGVPARWPAAPGGYLHLSAPYDGSAAGAAALGWPVERIAGAGHFHMLMDPVAVADALERVVAATGAARPAPPA
jgi:pimeloyl-ACP methyl ester carboxylesterase